MRERRNMMEIRAKIVSSLEKVFLDEEPKAFDGTVQGFLNERFSFQFAFSPSERCRLRVHAVPPPGLCVRLRDVRSVPVSLPTYPGADDHYLRKVPGLYPDLLDEPRPYGFFANAGCWYACWMDICPDENTAPGLYSVRIQVKSETDEILLEHTQPVRILPGSLPAQKLIHTKWFHCDALSEYYHVEAFGEEHWRIIENYILAAVAGGINMILMPVHTPPLDTRVGSERPTMQLVEISVDHGEMTFHMEKLHRWIRMCRRCGVKYYEVAHLFTQWGAKHAPKIMATVDGRFQRLFGWDTDACSEEYAGFLRRYIPALLDVFREEGMDRNTFWHVSDEPHPDQMDAYLHARELVAPLLTGYTIMDALSSYEFYRKGIVPCPIPSDDHIQPFLDAKVSGLWTYYCCGQYKDVPNMFIAMPSARNRILGVLLYRYEIAGFLQWGYNFWNSIYSEYRINPFACTDGDGAWPAGDPFQVYPGPDGQPLESIRMAVTREAMQDLRAMQWLESLAGRDAVLALLGDRPLTFTDYPREPEYLLELRERINAEIVRHL